VSPGSWSAQLARTQAREARRTLLAIRRSHERDVRWIDVALGYPKPTLLAVARRTFFRLSPNLPERRGHRAAHDTDVVHDRTAPDPSADTTGAEYTARLTALQQVWWKRVLPVQAPYRWNLRRLDLGFTLELGCGIGRNLDHLRGNAVGLDHNEASVRVARSRGFEALTTEEFATSRFARPHVFDSVLCAHVLEHMTREEAVDLLRTYLPHLRPGGKLVLITPQERGFASDVSHVEFLDEEALAQIIRELQLSVARSGSFPFPRSFGGLFVYNEFVVVGEA